MSRLFTIPLMLVCVAAIDVDYDKFQDKTTYSSPTMTMKLGRGSPEDQVLTLYLDCVKKGDEQSRPAASVTLLFTSVARDGVYLESHRIMTLRILADGKKGSVSIDDYNKQITDEYVREALFFRVRAADLTKLGAAKSVEMELYDTRFALSPQQIATVREFAAEIRKPAKRR